MQSPETTSLTPSAGTKTGLSVWLLRDLALGVIGPSTLGAFSAWHQLLDLCSHFRFQYLALLSIMAILLWRMKSPRWALMVVLAAAHNLVLVVPYYLLVKNVGEPAAKLSVVSFNVHASNHQSAAVLDYLQRKNPDVILLIEVDQRWMRELAPLQERYPHQVVNAAQEGPFGIALFSKLPIRRQEILGRESNTFTSIWVEMEFDGRRIGFLGTHPPPPVFPQWYQTRNEQLASLADTVKSRNLPTIVAGDFNATPWCSGFQRLIAKGNLIDTALGCGVQRTWNSQIPLLWIPIDHVLTTQEFVTHRRAVGPNCGSDHFAVEAELGLR